MYQQVMIEIIAYAKKIGWPQDKPINDEFLKGFYKHSGEEI